MENDNNGDCRRFMMNAISKHTSSISNEIDVPIICLDDDDDANDDNDLINIDKNYKVFFDHFRDDNSFGTLSQEANGDSETRRFNIFSSEPKLEYENPLNNRVKAEISRTRESIQRDNRVAERRKRKLVELEPASVSRFVPLVINQANNIQRDNKARILSESKVDETLMDVPLVRTQEVIRRDKKVWKIADLKAGTLRAVLLVRTEEDIQRDNMIAETKTTGTSMAVHLVKTRGGEYIRRVVRKVSESKVQLVRAQESIQRDNKVRNIADLETETLRDVPLVRTEEDSQGDNKVTEGRKRSIAETNDAGTSSYVPVKTVSEASKIVQRNKRVSVGRRKKNEEESVAVVDKDYMNYLTWLVNSLKNQTTKPNLQNDLSDFDHPDALKESTIVSEKELLVKPKVELDLEYSWSNDSDIIAISDSPFSDEECSPFVTSKIVIDLDKESEENESICSNCWFRKELMNVLEKPYNEGEFLKLSNEASMQRPVTRCRELRKGREKSYKSDELGPSYLERFSDFDAEYNSVDDDDHKARLELLRGFFFYLKYVSCDGSFKPWIKK